MYWNDEQLSGMIIPFYQDKITYPEGEKVSQIWQWNFQRLESVHNYIQWLFPLPEKSYFNPDAPILDRQTIITFRGDELLKDNLRKSLFVMLNFYGFECENREGKIMINKSSIYQQRQKQWLTLYNHNYLRITRILRCLTILGCQEYAEGFYQCLQKIYRESGDKIGEKTFRYWTNIKENI